MNKFLARLTSTERRFVAIVGLLVFVVLNLMLVRPYFSEWGKTSKRMDEAKWTKKKFDDALAEEPKYKKMISELQKEGASVPLEEQGIDFLRTIQSQAVQSGVNVNTSVSQNPRGTNQFFLEKLQALTTLSTEDQLVGFLYNLGGSGSMIRVRDLALRPDNPRQQLSGNIKLVGSYQKKPPARGAAPAAAPAKTPSPAKPASGAPVASTNKPATPTKK